MYPHICGLEKPTLSTLIVRFGLCQKMGIHFDQCFPKHKVVFSNVLLCPKHKQIQFVVIQEKRNQNMFQFKKLESENLDLFTYKMTN